MRIPFSQLRFRNKDEQVWGLQVTRGLFDTHPQNVFLIKFSYCFQL